MWSTSAWHLARNCRAKVESFPRIAAALRRRAYRTPASSCPSRTHRSGKSACRGQDQIDAAEVVLAGALDDDIGSGHDSAERDRSCWARLPTACRQSARAQTCHSTSRPAGKKPTILFGRECAGMPRRMVITSYWTSRGPQIGAAWSGGRRSASPAAEGVQRRSGLWRGATARYDRTQGTRRLDAAPRAADSMARVVRCPRTRRFVQ